MLNKSYALYETKKDYNVIKGEVPDFVERDITLAYTINGQRVDTSFFNKGSGHKVKNVTCENGVTATWNNEQWGLVNIKNPNNVSRIKCTINFEEYKEEILNGTEPVIQGDLVPVIIGENGKVTKADTDFEWYNYEKQQWANAVILTSSGKSKNFSKGSEISEEYIESYFVWIPKYSYKIWDLGQYTGITNIDATKAKAISIKFGTTNTSDSVQGECTTPMTSDKKQGKSEESGKCDIGKYMTHPAFISFGVNGLWVGKFETGEKGVTSSGTTVRTTYNANDLNKIIIKPNEYAWTNTNIGTIHKLAFNYKRTLDSHLIKNTEWGAVAYLTQSIYGRCTSSSCEEIMINNNSNRVTGYAAKNAPTSTSSNAEAAKPTQNGTNTVNYNNSLSVKASTTKNYSGIFDMSGGIREYVMGVQYESSNPGGDTTTKDLLTSLDSKYYDAYKYSTSYNDYKLRILGDATGELGPFGNSNISSYYNDEAFTGNGIDKWYVRSNDYNSGTKAGIFSYIGMVGGAGTDYGFRIVIAPKA